MQLRSWIAIGLFFAGLFGVNAYLAPSQDHSARMFWLHLTSPVVWILLNLNAPGLVLTR